MIKLVVVTVTLPDVWRGVVREHCGKCKPCTGMLSPSVCIYLVKFMHYKSKTHDRDMCVSQFSTFSIYIIIAILSKYFPTVGMRTYHPVFGSKAKHVTCALVGHGS